jgi:hypothetical protein
MRWRGLLIRGGAGLKLTEDARRRSAGFEPDRVPDRVVETGRDCAIRRAADPKTITQNFFVYGTGEFSCLKK